MSVRAVIAVLTLLVMLCGCFTTLQHPAVERERYLSPEITHRDACNKCHIGYATYSSDNPYALQLPFAAQRFTDWNYYYHYPWWLEDTFYPEAYKDSGATDGLPIDPRQYSNRRGLEPYSPNSMAAPAGAGIQLRKQATEGDSAQAATTKNDAKPKTDRSNLNSENQRIERTKKKD